MKIHKTHPGSNGKHTPVPWKTRPCSMENTPLFHGKHTPVPWKAHFKQTFFLFKTCNFVGIDKKKCHNTKNIYQQPKSENECIKNIT